MSNILPSDYKKKLLKDYRLRFLTVVTWMLTALVLSGAILLIPSYVMSGSVERSLRSRLESANGSGRDVISAEVINESKVTAEQLAYLDTYLGAITTPVKVFQLVRDAETEQVSVKGISISAASGAVEINGTAKTRNDLRSFADSLKKISGFSNVVLPLSNLASDRDIDFSLSLTVKDLVLDAATTTAPETVE